MNRAENFFKTESDENPYRIGAILIDPGHGGKDPGTSKTQKINGKNVTLVEKNINLSVGLKLRDYLKKAYPDKQILMARSKDVYLSLNQRTEIANGVRLKDNEAIKSHLYNKFNHTIKTTLLDDLLKKATTSYQNVSGNMIQYGDINVNETLFFWPLKHAIYEVSKNHKQYK